MKLETVLGSRSDRPTALLPPHALDCIAALASATPRRTPRRDISPDHVTMKTYYYGGQSIEEDTNANETPIFALTFDLDL